MSETKKMVSKTKRKNNKESSTITERNAISPNWQAFLQNQEKNSFSNKSKMKQEVNDYYKVLRAEAQIPQMNKKSILNKKNISNVKNPDGSPVITRYVAMDCEMVGIGEKGVDSMLARVSLVNKFGDCIYDKFVQARENVVDYRTCVSGVRKEDLINGERFDVVQKEVAEILKGRYLVGHALRNDLDVLFLSHPASKIRDTSKYKPFKMITKGRIPSLKRLSEELLGVNIQKGEHSSVEDARATMQLYCLHARHWEDMIKKKKNRKFDHSKST
ncbi:RNA exonuclease 4 isoform X2 [Arctopsyche grandis]